MFEEPKYKWYFKIKPSAFSKAIQYKIELYRNSMRAICNQIHTSIDNEIVDNIHELELKYDEIKDVYEYIYQNKDYIRIDTSYHITKNSFFLIPANNSLYDVQDFKSKLLYLIDDCITRKENAEKLEIELQEKRAEKLMLEKQQQQEFYNNTYNFHIKEDTPKYVFESSENYISLLYLNSNNDINFLTIDGFKQKEVNGILSYNDIHYYEKAGTIHYVSDINIDYQGKSSFGGSFKSGKVSIGAAMLGGLLFGPMGMAIGTMASYKPSEYKPPKYTPEKLKVNSEPIRIDERSIILNYYSKEYKQFKDIELPADIFNFFQTYLPQKKYDVVIELEKSQAKQLQQPLDNVRIQQDSSDIESIKQRLKNLKELYIDELISEEEYLNRKKEILSEI